jgi:hypothetical protein
MGGSKFAQKVASMAVKHVPDGLKVAMERRDGKWYALAQMDGVPDVTICATGTMDLMKKLLTAWHKAAGTNLKALVHQAAQAEGKTP